MYLISCWPLFRDRFTETWNFWTINKERCIYEVYEVSSDRDSLSPMWSHCITPVSAPGLLSVLVSVWLCLFLVSFLGLRLFLSRGFIYICLFLLSPFLISCSKRVYWTSQICIQYTKKAQIQSTWERKRKTKERHKVQSETRLIQKCILWSPTHKATGAINFLYTL